MELNPGWFYFGHVLIAICSSRSNFCPVVDIPSLIKQCSQVFWELGTKMPVDISSLFQVVSMTSFYQDTFLRRGHYASSA